MKISEALAYAVDTKCFLNGEVIEESGSAYREYFGDSPAFLVADENTYEVAGVKTERAFARAGVKLVEPVLFPGKPTLACDYEISQTLRTEIDRRSAVPVAIGSGTLNDLVKVAAFQSDLRYMNVSTAASVDGYTAPGASIIRNGFKNSIYCRAPLVIVADSGIIASAPAAMTSSGYADLAGKYTAGADWVIADRLGIEKIDDIAWRMVHEGLESRLNDPDGIAAGNDSSIEKLFLGLGMTGLAMQHLRKSRPASGLEHLMSHVWEMSGLAYAGVHVSHGFKVAIGTLASTALSECVFRRDPGAFSGTALEGWILLEQLEKEVQACFKEPLFSAVLAESREKHVSREEHAGRVAEICAKWEVIRHDALEVLLPYGEMKRLLGAAGAPVVPEEIGLTREAVADTYRKASYIRNRYTVVDLALDLGILDSCVAEILDSDSYLR